MYRSPREAWQWVKKLCGATRCRLSTDLCTELRPQALIQPPDDFNGDPQNDSTPTAKAGMVIALRQPLSQVLSMAELPSRFPRALKLLVGGLLILVAGYFLVGERLAGTSADAVVNARVLYVRAPIDGELTADARNLGSRLSQGAAIGSIVDPRPPDVRLLELQREETFAKADIERLTAQIAVLNTSLADFRVQAELYRKGRLQQLDARLAEAKAVVEAAEARLREAMRVFQRSSDLSTRGIESITNLDRARAEQDVRKQELEQAKLRINFLEIERDAATSGTFLGDSFNDAPYSEQRIRDIQLRLGELQAEVAQQRVRAELFNKQLAAERLRTGRMSEAALTAPVNSVLWEALAGTGEFVRRGQDLFKLLDCSTLIVTASVSESLYNSLSVGDPARFRLLGGSDVYEGSVIRLAGPGALGVYGSLAIGPSREHLTRFDVAITVPQLNRENLLACGVGRTGRVVFSDTPQDFWRDLLYRIGF